MLSKLPAMLRAAGTAVAFLIHTAAATSHALAQDTGTLRGVVVQEGDRLPVPGAIVGLSGARFRTLTDPLGRFTLPAAATGRQYLLVRAFGYRPDSVAVTIEATPSRVSSSLATARVRSTAALSPSTSMCTT